MRHYREVRSLAHCIISVCWVWLHKLGIYFPSGPMHLLKMASNCTRQRSSNGRTLGNSSVRASKSVVRLLVDDTRDHPLKCFFRKVLPQKSFVSRAWRMASDLILCKALCFLNNSILPWYYDSFSFTLLLNRLQTSKPWRFDDELPDISVNDLEYLKSCCPVEVQPFLM